LQARLEKMMRTNTFNADASTITIDPVRAEAYKQIK